LPDFGGKVTWPTVVKTPRAAPVAPNLVDYERARAEFSWEAARRELGGLPGGRGLNIAHEAIDRHAAGPQRDHLALRWLGKRGEVEDYTYGRLQELTNRFANVLAGLGVGQGDRVYALAGRVPELYVAALGTLKNQGVFCPLFSAFGPEPIRTRLGIGRARVLVTTASLYERKVALVRPTLPHLEHVLLIGDDRQPTAVAGTRDYQSLMAVASDRFTIAATAPEDPALLHFTSGTTGTPKGALHVHDAVVAHHVTGRLALDLHPEDVFWCTADPGWVTGIVRDHRPPDERGDEHRRRRRLRRRPLVRHPGEGTGDGLVHGPHGHPHADEGRNRARPHARVPPLRFLASVGEPLNPEAVVWGQDAFGLPFHDNWWQTETGGIMIANFAALDIRPGSMGRPLPGVEATIVRKAGDGRVEVVEEPDVQGELALRPGWPSMFRAYWEEPERYRKCFAGGFYLTGDLARRDRDGYFWFVGRADDVIKTSGHLVGPFEVESVLLEHKAVAEAGVIGKPDPVAGEVVKAFVSLKDGHSPTPELRRDLSAFARTRLGAVVAPKEIEFRPSLPKTRSGKIMRRLLRAQELGLPEGDTSTLETS
jgi:acetyl-CoA synthetase